MHALSILCLVGTMGSWDSRAPEEMRITSIPPWFEDPVTFFYPTSGPKIASMEDAIAQTFTKANAAGLGGYPAQILFTLELYVYDDADPSTVALNGSPEFDFLAQLDGWIDATAIALGKGFWCYTDPSVLMSVLFHEAVHTTQQMPPEPPGPPAPPAVEQPHLAAQREIVNQYRWWESVVLELDAFEQEKDFAVALHGMGCFADDLFCSFMITRDSDLRAYQGVMALASERARAIFDSGAATTPDLGQPLPGYSEAVAAMGLGMSPFADESPQNQAQDRMTNLGVALGDCASQGCPDLLEIPLLWESN